MATTLTRKRTARNRSRRAADPARRTPAHNIGTGFPPVRVELTVEEILADLVYPAKAPKPR